MVAACPEPPASSPALTLNPPQAAILSAFIAHNFDPTATAAAVSLSILDLLAWHRDPAVQAALADLEALELQAVELAQLAARCEALRTLRTLAGPDSDPTERRRAAAAILWHGRPRAPVPAPSPSTRRPPWRHHAADTRSPSAAPADPNAPSARAEQAQANAALRMLEACLGLEPEPQPDAVPRRRRPFAIPIPASTPRPRGPAP